MSTHAKKLFEHQRARQSDKVEFISELHTDTEDLGDHIVVDRDGNKNDLTIELVHAATGLPFKPIDEIWEIARSSSGRIKFNPSGIPPLIIRRMQFIVCVKQRKLAARSLAKYSDITTQFLTETFKQVGTEQTTVDIGAIRKWALDILPNFAASTHGNNLSALRFFAMAERQLLPDDSWIFTPEAFDLLMSIKHKPKGRKRSIDEEKGRFDSKTEALIRSKIKEAWNNGVDPKLSTEQFLLLQFHLCFGERPVQLVDQKVLDFKKTESNGAIKYVLEIPFGKRQGGVTRDKFTRLEVAPKLAALIERHIEENGLLDDDPLFPLHGQSPESYRQRGLRPNHPNEQALTAALNEIAKILEIPFAINTYRWRYTLGTWALGELGPMEAGHLLTHESPRSIKSYGDPAILAANFDGLARDIHGANLELFEVADSLDMFKGEVVKQIDVPDQKTQLPSLKHYPVSDLDQGGCSSSESKCRKGMPYACYACRHMRAYENGPHEKYLKHTINLYIGLKQEDNPTADSYLAPIYGMARVISLIREIKNDRA